MIQVKQNDGTIVVVDPIMEFKKCKLDPIYFIDHYCYIVDPVKGELPFKLFEYQKRIVKEYQQHRFNIIKKPRQMGLSWLTACYGLWLINFHNDKTVLVISIRDKEAMEFKEKARYSYDRMPDFLRMETADRSKHSLNLINGSQFQSIPQTKNAGRSKSLSLLILDEIAFQEYDEDIWAAAWPTLSTGGNAILISTTNGIGNLYHRIYTEAQNGENDFNIIDINWWDYPGRDEKWLIEQKRQLPDERKFRAEILCEFLGSGDTVLDPETLEKLDKLKKPPIIQNKIPALNEHSRPTSLPGLWIWEKVISGHEYILAADVGAGNGKDASAFQVIDLNTNEQVAEFKNKLINTHDYADAIKKVAEYYNKAFVIIESNSWGLSTFMKLYYDENSPYTNVYVSKNGKASWETTGKSRPQIIDSMVNSINDVKINSQRLISELQTFVWHGSKPEAERGYNDDLVIAFALAVHIKNSISTYKPLGITSTRDVAPFKYDEKSTELYQRELFKGLSGEDNTIVDDTETEFDENGMLTDKAIYKWLVG